MANKSYCTNIEDVCINYMINKHFNRNKLTKCVAYIQEKIENNNGENSIDILELDSLGSMELCIALELNHNVLISPEELFLCNKVSDLLKIIKKRLIKKNFVWV